MRRPARHLRIRPQRTEHWPAEQLLNAIARELWQHHAEGRELNWVQVEKDIALLVEQTRRDARSASASPTSAARPIAAGPFRPPVIPFRGPASIPPEAPAPKATAAASAAVLAWVGCHDILEQLVGARAGGGPPPFMIHSAASSQYAPRDIAGSVWTLSRPELLMRARLTHPL